MRPQLTFLPPAAAPTSGRLVLFQPGSEALSACAEMAADLGLEGGEASTARLAVLHHGQITAVEHPVLAIPLAGAILPLARAAKRSNSPSVRSWALATRIALQSVRAQHLLPRLTAVDEADPTGEKELLTTVYGGWRVDTDANSSLAAALARLAQAMPPSAHAVIREQDRVWEPLSLLGRYLDAVADTLVRRAAPPPSGRPRARLLPWTTRWHEALGDPADPVVPLKEDGADLAASIEGWQARSDTDGTPVLTLIAPDSPADEWRLDLGLRTDDEQDLTAEQVWETADPELTEVFMAGLSRASRVFAPIDAALAEHTPASISLTLDAAWSFLADAAPTLQGAGVVVVLPSTLGEDSLTAQISLNTMDDDTVEARWDVALDDRVLDDEELGALSQLEDPLAFFGGRWVRLDDETRAALAARGRTERISKAEALALALAGSTGEEWFGEGTAAGRVVADETLAGLIAALEQAGDLEHVPASPDGFVGELRPYQQRGVAWLRGMVDLGLGAVLADAMGLGKTIQLIALLVAREGPFLVVCPTSVVGNWQREIAKFGPGLEITHHHGPERATSVEDLRGVVVTSYGTLRRDVDLLDQVDWDLVCLDEAQQVKNPATAAAQAVRRLRSKSVLALTGTPLENRLAELWAIIDATNRGLLGSRGAFSKRFVGPVENRRDAAAAARLRRLVSPLIMRRVKDDPEIAKDLPDKIERTVICALTSEQAALYKRVTAEHLEKLSSSDGMARRGRVLAMLTALKQVANHPAQYLKEPGPLPSRSGKLGVLREIVAEATDAGDSVLVFTQYVAMGKLLGEQLTADLGTSVPFLHGGLSLGARDDLVEDFQSGDAAPVLIVSTRAGGTGLNLTAATHVIHYDRWWNPAVEDQATDRAHRIGQTRTVEVHKLVTAGTLEERIAEMLEQKRALADAVVGAGESWITEMDDAALAELVQLSADARIADPDEPLLVGAGAVGDGEDG